MFDIVFVVNNAYFITDMAKITKSEIEKAHKQFREKFAADVSPQALNLIQELLNTIIEDPDPSWAKKSKSDRDAFAHQILDALPSLLADVAGKKKKIIAPDVLHWLGVQWPQPLVRMGFVFDKK